jgi:hypothetical protein
MDEKYQRMNICPFKRDKFFFRFVESESSSKVVFAGSQSRVVNISVAFIISVGQSIWIF